MASDLPLEPPAWTRIPVRSERQAMDWSLVLASQGIEVIIHHEPETDVWALKVDALEVERSRQILHRYRLENRGWGWHRRLVWPAVSFHWGALVWCWCLILWYWLGEGLGPRLEGVGIMDAQATLRGEVWRLLTAATLHGDVAHLAANTSTGLVVLGLAMGRFGAGWTVLATLVAGGLGNVASLYAYRQPHASLGASGMVMGGLGLLAAQLAFLLWESPRAWRQALSGLLGGCLLFVLVGLNPATDVAAHAGGFVAGIAAGAVLASAPRFCRRWGHWDAWAGGLALVAITVAWSVAWLVGQPVFRSVDVPR